MTLVTERPTTSGTERYESHCTMPFGEKPAIPAPFDCVLDTTSFGAPKDNGQV
ncbi:hypothetical protein [Streptomyces zaehneri]|uniref:hypothetical protein n=1 Tax=Streptomyces zaehneri TaxID=3051180 RepID=UPI0028D772F8|nr:hypothetical protein [Streptomyces sp. DSM 40713]